MLSSCCKIQYFNIFRGNLNIIISTTQSIDFIWCPDKVFARFQTNRFFPFWVLFENKFTGKRICDILKPVCRELQRVSHMWSCWNKVMIIRPVFLLQPFMSPRYPGGPRPSLRMPNQPPGSIPGSQPLLPNSLDPTRPQGNANMWCPFWDATVSPFAK